MAKLTPEQKKQLEELQALADAPDEEDEYEVWVKNDKGHETRLPSRKAAGWLRENFGISLHDDEPADDGGAGDGDDGGDDGDDGQDPAPKGGGYFTRRKA